VTGVGEAVDYDFRPLPRARLINAAMRLAPLPTAPLIVVHLSDLPFALTAAAVGLGQRLWTLYQPGELVLTAARPEGPDMTGAVGRLVQRTVSFRRGRGWREHLVSELMSDRRYAAWQADTDR
jgi:hypothetical protein